MTTSIPFQFDRRLRGGLFRVLFSLSFVPANFSQFPIDFLFADSLLLFLLQATVGKKEKYKAFKQFLDAVIAISGILLIYFTVKEAIASHISLNVLDLLVSFLIPIAFSALYLPIAYLFAVYAKYQLLFIRMTFKSPKSKKLKRKHRWTVFVACGLSYKQICKFEKEYVKRLYVSLPESEFIKLIQEFKAG